MRQSPAVFLRNLHIAPLYIPLSPSARYLPPGDTAGPLPGAIVHAPTVAQAVLAGLLVAVILPPADGRWRLAGVAIRAPISASARHWLAIDGHMAHRVHIARMGLRAVFGAADAEERAAHKEWRSWRARELLGTLDHAR